MFFNYTNEKILRNVFIYGFSGKNIFAAFLTPINKNVGDVFYL